MNTDSHRVPRPSRATLDWLLQSSNPPVRYLALRRLLGKSEKAPDVLAAKRAAWKYGPIQESLRNLLDVRVVEPVDLSILAIVGLSREEPAVDRICQRVMDGQIRRQSGYGCYVGHILGSLIRLGYFGDPRLEPMIAAILREQRFLDGNRPGTELRYGRLSIVCVGSHSCFSAVAWSLWAMMAIPPGRRTPEIREFLRRGADFLRAHRVYQRNHARSQPVRSEWLKLTLPYGLGWRTSVLHLLEVAGQVGLAGDPASADAVESVLSKRDARARWHLETRYGDRTTGCGPLWAEETVGQPSKWVTLSALTALQPFAQTVQKPKRGTPPVAREESREESGFAPYPFVHEPARERKVREEWASAGMRPVLEALLAFARDNGLRTGWQHGLVIGPEWCREWAFAQVAWVPRPRFDKAWPACRLCFLAPKGQFTPEGLAQRLGIPVDDDRERARFPKLYRHQFWRIRMAPWRNQHDEVALALRSLPELKAAMPVLAESLRTLPKSFDAHAGDRRP